MRNEVLNTMKTRRSCRCYLDKMPEPEALNAVLEAVRQMEVDRFFFIEVRMDLTGNLSASLQKIRNVLERCGSVRISLNWMENTFS